MFWRIVSALSRGVSVRIRATEPMRPRGAPPTSARRDDAAAWGLEAREDERGTGAAARRVQDRAERARAEAHVDVGQRTAPVALSVSGQPRPATRTLPP